jgi:hypothetical protein
MKQIVVFFVVFSELSVLIFASDSLVVSNSTDLTKVFSALGKEQKSAVTCTSKVKTSSAFVSCAQDVAKDYNGKDTSTKNLCCLAWDVADCLLDEAKKQCTQADYDEMLRNLKNNGAAVGCADYPYGSYKCHFPWWGILLIVVGAISIIGLIAFLVVRNRRHRHHRHDYH